MIASTSRRTQVLALAAVTLLPALAGAASPQDRASRRKAQFETLRGGADDAPRAPRSSSTKLIPLGYFWKGPKVAVVRSGEVGSSPLVDQIVGDLRGKADYGVFLAGGASKMSAEDQSKLLGAFGALKDLAAAGDRFVVGDGGTSEGIMQAAGKAKRKSGGAFSLLGVAPAPNVLPGGDGERAQVSKYQPQIDHDYLVAIEPPDSWLEEQKGYGWEPSWGFWGAETGPMYQIFARLAEGKPSVAVIANGGGITYNEVKANMAQGRKIIALCGSGRVTDAICHELWGTDASRAEKLDKIQKVPEGASESLVKQHKDLFIRLDLDAGAEGLAQAIRGALGR